MNHDRPATRRNSQGLIAPRLGVVLAILGGLAGLAFLIPDRDQLLKRFLTDGDAAAASQLLGDDSLQDPAAVTRALTLEILTLGERSDWNASTTEVLANFLQNHEEFGTAADVVTENIARIPAHACSPIFAALITRSLAEGDLPRAVAAQDLLLSRTATLTPELVRQAVTTYRYHGDPARALDLINRLQDQSPELPGDLRELRVTLARETSRPDLAFNMLAIKIRSTRNPEALRKLIPEAVTIGQEAGQMEALIPLYQRYLAISGNDNDPLVRDYAFRLAKTYEWTGKPDLAFDAYLDLAAGGDREALDRVLTLNAGLFRTAEVVELLLSLEELVDRDDELLALTARLLAEAARRDEAVAHYERLLARQPENAGAHFRIGLVHDERMDFERALPHFRAAHRLDPENGTVLHRLARCCVALQDYSEALAHFRTLVATSDDPEFAEELNTLAYSLDDTEALKISLARLLELKPGPVFAMALAELHREEGNSSQAIAVLDEAIARIDNDLSIRLELAQILIKERRPDRALTVLAPVSLREWPDAVPLVANALSALPASPYASRLPAALRTYGPTLAQSEALLPSSLIDLATLEKRFGSATRGQQLLRRALRECTAPGDLAQAQFWLGRPREALGQQLAHIKQSRRVVSEDYHFLGDIYSALDQKSNAESAYKYAVVLLKKRLTRNPR